MMDKKPGMVVAEISRQVCPWCGHKLDRNFAVSKVKSPDPGDVVVCFYCCLISVYGEDLALRKPSAEEGIYLRGDDQLRGMQKSLLEAKR